MGKIPVTNVPRHLGARATLTNGKSSSSYDVAIIGAGPVGCVAALAFADRGARVLLLEQNPRAAMRLAGEWLHPPAVEILERLGVHRTDLAERGELYPTGRGFAVFPDDGSERIVLPYASGTGFSCEHRQLVSVLRGRVEGRREIELRCGARATVIDGQMLGYEQHGAEHTVRADLIVGAGGRSSIVHQALGVSQGASTYSRMAGLILEDAVLPEEGYGHVLLGGLGPVLAYRLDRRRIRMCLDVPLALRVDRDRSAVLWDAYRVVIPAPLLPAFRAALVGGEIAWASNQIRPRVELGREGLALIGDAVGHHHPLTALGITFGFQDAVALARTNSFAAYRRERIAASRVPQMLAVALYEVFADTSDEFTAIRGAVYELWRSQPVERKRTMQYLAAQDTHPLRFGGSFIKTVTIAARDLARAGIEGRRLANVRRVAADLVSRTRWLLAGALDVGAAKPSKQLDRNGASAASQVDVVEHPASARQTTKRSAEPMIALERGVGVLKSLQANDGSWEGECRWCALLPAQYTIACHLIGRPISERRRRLLLRQFEVTRDKSGTWGLHELSEPYLFVTALVYVAARLLGVAANDPLIDRARRFIAAEGGAVAIPSWGKFWLAMVGLYEWEGVNPVLPELWRLPRWMPLHPSNYYCHTRLIYLGMASCYGRSFDTVDRELIGDLRGELFPAGYDAVDFRAARTTLRDAEIFTPPSMALGVGYRLLKAIDARCDPEHRLALTAELVEHIRFELATTDYTCISPVSGMLGILALHLHDPADPDLPRALDRFEGWIWEDEQAGTRVAGARSASWDTAFAVQALTTASPHVDVTAALERGDGFLRSQQIGAVERDYRAFYRVPPTGGYCFAGVWHGWPVSDCTAEAMCARLEAPDRRATEAEMIAAARFVLQSQNRDGGFGSYEPQKTRIPLEWLNPAEMFGDSMTEHSYSECTASCISALAAFRHRHPELLRDSIDRAIARGARRLRLQQRADGAWSGCWGIHFSYGTLFGIRGLLRAGAPPQDPAIRKACGWLKAHQRPDGGWSEHHTSSLTDRYAPTASSQVIQTSWALAALLEAQDPDWDAIERAADFLARAQLPDGRWPKEQPAGVFFHTAALDYQLYRVYFPVWALGLYQTRQLARSELAVAARRPTTAPGPTASEPERLRETERDRDRGDPSAGG